MCGGTRAGHGAKGALAAHTLNGRTQLCFVRVLQAVIHLHDACILVFGMLSLCDIDLTFLLAAGGVNQGDCSTISAATAKLPPAARLHLIPIVVFSINLPLGSPGVRCGAAFPYDQDFAQLPIPLLQGLDNPPHVSHCSAREAVLSMHLGAWCATNARAVEVQIQV